MRTLFPKGDGQNKFRTSIRSENLGSVDKHLYRCRSNSRSSGRSVSDQRAWSRTPDRDHEGRHSPARSFVVCRNDNRSPRNIHDHLPSPRARRSNSPRVWLSPSRGGTSDSRHDAEQQPPSAHHRRESVALNGTRERRAELLQFQTGPPPQSETRPPG